VLVWKETSKRMESGSYNKRGVSGLGVSEEKIGKKKATEKEGETIHKMRIGDRNGGKRGRGWGKGGGGWGEGKGAGLPWGDPADIK